MPFETLDGTSAPESSEVSRRVFSPPTYFVFVSVMDVFVLMHVGSDTITLYSAMRIIQGVKNMKKTPLCTFFSATMARNRT
jgi:hypothetical protein